MSDTFLQKDTRNFYKLKWLDVYMIGHKGFIAGGCFKNIFNEEKVKDIDIFFENETDYIEAKKYYDDSDNFSLYYQNNKVTSYKDKRNDMRIELIKSTYGKPDDILRQFDFSIVKFAYYKELAIDSNDEDEEEIEYKIIHHRDFFEHLMMKRLVVNKELKFPNSTFERTLRYAKYGYTPCKESKINIINAIKNNDNQNDTLSESLYEGWD